jgi:hypothetical protein
LERGFHDETPINYEEYDPFWSAYASPFQLMRRMSKEMDRVSPHELNRPRRLEIKDASQASKKE